MGGEEVEEIGLRLREAREAKGLALEAAEDETKIRRKYLEALESGNPAELPGEVYLKGFLRSYGNWLGFDGDSLVEEYKSTSTARRAGNRSAPTIHDAAASQELARKTSASLRANSRRLARDAALTEPIAAPVHVPRLTATPKKVITGRGLLTGVMLGAVVGLISYMGWMVAGKLGTPAPASLTNPPPVAPIPDPPKVIDTPTTPPPQLPDPPKTVMTKGPGDQVHFLIPAGEISLRLEFSDTKRLWMAATVDKVVVYDGFPSDKGTPLDFKGKAMSLRMGHMDGVSLVINGQRFDKPLDRGPYTLVLSITQ